MSKIGLGIVTCNRPDFLSNCIKSIDLSKVDEKVIVNDGKVDVKHPNFTSYKK
jgi:GT2 family glycosyltransferase